MAIKLANQCIIEPLISITGAYQTGPCCPPVQSVHKRWQTQLLHFTDMSWLRPYNGQTAAPPASTSLMMKTLFAQRKVINLWLLNVEVKLLSRISSGIRLCCKCFNKDFGDVEVICDLHNNSWLKNQALRENITTDSKNKESSWKLLLNIVVKKKKNIKSWDKKVAPFENLNSKLHWHIMFCVNIHFNTTNIFVEAMFVVL